MLNNFQQKRESEDAFSDMMENHVGKNTSVSTSFVSNVFAMMTLALAISGVSAYWMINSGVWETLPSIMITVLRFAPLILVLVMGFAYKKLSSVALTGVFLVYSVLMGMSIGLILLGFSTQAVASTFGITSATFLSMALLGYTTKTDLTKFGSLLFMGLIGIIIAMVVNTFFIESTFIDYIISIIGVLVFTGLTAYDVQKIKNMSAQVVDGAEETKKMVVMGALNLYLDFVNLFLFLLRIFGSRD